MNFSQPNDISPAAKRAHAAILEVLERAGITAFGRAFYSPAEWRERGEAYGRGGILIVVYEGEDFGKFFSLDLDYPRYAHHEQMRLALEAAGFYAEECTGWYSAIYPIHPS